MKLKILRRSSLKIKVVSYMPISHRGQNNYILPLIPNFLPRISIITVPHSDAKSNIKGKKSL